MKATSYGCRVGVCLLGIFAVMILAAPLVQAQTVVTVPWVPGTSNPHTTYNYCTGGSTPIPNYTATPPTCAGGGTLTESTIWMGAIATLPNTTDTYTGVWDFGDGSPNVSFTVSNTSLINYNVGTTHQYPASAAASTPWTATLTVTDNNTKAQGSASYPVIQEQDTLQSRVNVAIDGGLWFAHTTMWRSSTTVGGQTINTGGWDDSSGSPGCVNFNDCTSYGGLDANYVQAFEVNGHQANGPSSDPYSDDVARGLARMWNFLDLIPTASKSVSYNPAVEDVRCSDGSVPTSFGPPPTCATGTPVKYNPTATSCTSPPCNFTFDTNSNGNMIVEFNDSGDPGYQEGMFVDSIVASGNATGKINAAAGGVYAESFLDVASDLVDGILFCQYGGDPYNGSSNGYDNGGGWAYYCQNNFNYDDNSISQWNAVGLIGAERGFGISIPTITTDTNDVWVTWSQETNNSEGCGNCTDTATIGGTANSNLGAFGYDEYAYEPWGPFADTPSGMVQMDMDKVGRTAAGAADQRWNLAETFYHDNFCYNFTNTSAQNNYYDPLFYTYGMFSFSKAMRLYDPGGSLSPLTFVQDEPAGTNPIDWYGALSSANGGTDPCDGFAQTLVSRQQSTGGWGKDDSTWDQNSTQAQFETAWALIILKGSVFVECINAPYGRGTPSGLQPARIDLTWSAQPLAVSYNVLRSTTNGGPYTQVGTSTSTSYSDRVGLSNGGTYYYVVQPVNSAPAEICQSAQETVTIPK
jgi:hypothetical protein